jgi:hypothetical protein
MTEIPKLEKILKTFLNKKQIYDKLYIKCYFCGMSTHVISKCKSFLKNNNLIYICIIILIKLKRNKDYSQMQLKNMTVWLI